MVYRFGGFTLDDGTRRLLWNDGELHLTSKAFELLTMLLAHRGLAVSKADVQERLWPATFVQETNIAGLVAEIRRALRDSASKPLFVRTVYRFGYRFAGEATEEWPSPQPAAYRAKPYLICDQRQIIVMEGANIIGRAADATIQIDSPGVSRYHARILVSNGQAILEDLGSKNGTHLNGSRITHPATLSDASEIRLGAIVMTFRIGPSTSPTETVAGERG